MNWRKGFFRLWILISIGWVVLVGLFSYGSISSPWFEPRGFYYKVADDAEGPRDLLSVQATAELDRRRIGRGEVEPSLQPVSVERYSAEYRAFEEAKVAGDVQIIEFMDIPEVVLFVPSDLPENELERRAVEVHDIALKVKGAVVQLKRTRALEQAAAAGFIPPAILLVIGLGIAWAASGFRHEA